jgi:hypothetical protein
LKTNAQLLNEIAAAMADTWLAACDRRVIGTTPEGKHLVVDRHAAHGVGDGGGGYLSRPDREQDVQRRRPVDEHAAFVAGGRPEQTQPYGP